MIGPLIAITGGPGAGKTTLVDALAKAECSTVAEAGRAILEEQRANSGSATHNDDQKRYAALQLTRCLNDYDLAKTHTGPVWFDRSIIDVYGYYLLIGLPIPDAVKRACDQYRYAKDALIAPHWSEIYRNDALRKQNEAEAEATGEAVREAYTVNGYRLIELPKTSVADRIAFATEHSS